MPEGNSKLHAQITAIVLTYNEESNLPYCLASLEGAVARTFVVDSGSSDQTTRIANNAGARVVYHPFSNQAEQFNWALDHLPLASDWILRIDADEYLLPELALEMREAIAGADPAVTGFYCKRRMIFLNQWIRHGAYYPVWIMRLFRNGCARSESVEMDEHIVLLRGVAQRLKYDIVDHNRKGLSAWTVKHERYASRQARVIAGQIGKADPCGVRARIFGNQVERKRWLKHNLYGRVPLFIRPVLYLCYRYFFRLGILDGIPGLVFHTLHAGWFLFYVDARIYEMRQSARKELCNGSSIQ